MKVLSLFDGMSCAQIALNKLGVKNYTYYASEIDKYSIKITQKNYPDTIQVGDVRMLSGRDFKDIDLIVCGSPCQGFSFAGQQLAFDDPRSKLFFEFVRLLKEIKPKYFLLENVRMKKEFLSIISQYCGVEPYLFNSAKVSAQNRLRYYWTNIDVNKHIEDKGILLKDILETEPENYTKMSNNFVKRNREKNCMIDFNKEKAHNLSAMEYVKNGRQGNYLACDNDGKPKQVGMASNINGHDILKRVYSPEGKSPTLNSMGGGNREPKVAIDDVYWRKLTPLECERLQTVPDNYTEGVSNSQRYKMLGNGFSVDIIVHILKHCLK